MIINSSNRQLAAKNYLLVCFIFYSDFVFSDAPKPLPEPLSLEYALGLSKNINEDLAFRIAEKNEILLDKSLADAQDGFNLSVEGRATRVERRNSFFSYIVDEQKLALRLTKSIYDFGNHKHTVNASDKLLDSNSLLYLNEIYSRQIKIMAAYFDILLADLRFHRNNENMAIAFISWDNSRKELELGKNSDLEVEKNHSEYQRVRRERFESENNQRQTRNRLANLMNSSGQLPASLATPSVSSRLKKYPEIEKLTKKAFENNLELRALRKKIESVQSSVRALQSKMKPQINFESEAIAYANELSRNSFSRENWNVGVVVGMPIYDSGEMDSQVAKVRVEIYRLETLIAQKKMNIQHELLSLKLKLDTLRFERDEADAFNEYSELFLDEKRALYELEVKSTLGTAMVQISDAQYGVAKSLYETLLTWAKIDLLVGDEPAEKLFKN
ncbi:hypothetical protein MNBD_GAMMA22-2749 [hydrothermal vent metagenome]|uniref:Outer membrane efflux protein n=1 Tax=hydrothermal vent metagenome TaxID=652676 RepID=A0A3B1ACI0_9ZZZZ